MDGEIRGVVGYRTRMLRDGGFEEHAALEAIDAAIRDADAARRELERHLEWLKEVRARRRQEIDAGKGPSRQGAGAAKNGTSSRQDAQPGSRSHPMVRS